MSEYTSTRNSTSPHAGTLPEYETRPLTYARLATNFFKTFPQLAGIKFTHGWGGAIDTCSRFSPFWGTDFDGKVAYVLGYTGLGVATTVPNLPISSATDSSFYCNGVGGFSISNNFFI